LLGSCRLCPRNCGVDRTAGKTGFCRAPLKPKVARAALHFWEEPCLSGVQGSGAVFFSHCNLKCTFCQNYRISQEHFGREVDIPTLTSIFRELEQQAHIVNAVFQHGHPLNSHPKGKTRDFFGIITGNFQHPGVHHP
jgi:putative pyruvate formate lyase activating enzyme